MDAFRFVFLTLILLTPSQIQTQGIPPHSRPDPIEITVCEILRNPSAFNNKIVKTRGSVEISSEYSMLQDLKCPDAVWFALADNIAPPGLIAIVEGKASPGAADLKGANTPAIAVHLVKDSGYHELMRWLELSAKGRSCTDSPPPDFPPDCRTYRVTATFIGRIDSVSKAIHEAHLKRSSGDKPDFRGFGHMGMFDAQLVVQSVENVVAAEK